MWNTDRPIEVTGIRPMAPVHNRGPLENIWEQDLSFSARTEIIENNNSLVVNLFSKVGENEFLQTL